MRNAQCNNSEDNLFLIRCMHTLDAHVEMASFRLKQLHRLGSILLFLNFKCILPKENFSRESLNTAPNVYPNLNCTDNYDVVKIKGKSVTDYHAQRKNNSPSFA